MSDLFQIAELIENESSEPTANELVDFARRDDPNAPQSLRSIEAELTLSERAVTDLKLGSAGSVRMGRRQHARMLGELAQLGQDHARAREEISRDPDLSDGGKQKRLESLAKQQQGERAQAIAKATERSDEILNARESKLRNELTTSSKTSESDPVVAALQRIEAFEHARLYLDQIRRMKPNEANRAVVELVTRDPVAAPHVIRAAAILYASDDAHATQLAGFVTGTVNARKDARVRKAFSDTSSARARAAVELALLQRTREQIRIHHEQIAKDSSAAAALLANFKPEEF